MGNAVDEVSAELWLNGKSVSLSSQAFDQHIDWLAASYRLKNRLALDDLIYDLVGYASRDQDQETSTKDMTRRRAEGSMIAKRLSLNARKMSALLDEIAADIVAFDKTVRWSPSLLEAIFDLDTGGPSNLFLPPEISILQDFFDGTEFWDDAASKLQILANIPGRPGKTGRMADVTLQKCLARCRAYWSQDEDRSWSMYKLTEAKIRRGGLRADLKGECEQFVANALSLAGVHFDLQRLNSAWLAIDKV